MAIKITDPLSPFVGQSGRIVHEFKPLFDMNHPSYHVRLQNGYLVRVVTSQVSKS